MAENVFLQDKNGETILPATDWANIQNKPSDLATTAMLPKLNAWSNQGLEYNNGAYDWDHANNGMNCAYRIADFNSFKIVELRLAFAVNQDITAEKQAITLPKIIRADGDEEVWSATGVRGIFVHFRNDAVFVYCQQFGQGDKYTANGLLTFHTMYLSTL